MPDGETPNQLIPREFAIVHIARQIAELRHRIDAYNSPDGDDTPGSYFHSRLVVFLEQTIVELRRAAHYLETTDMSDDPG